MSEYEQTLVKTSAEELAGQAALAETGLNAEDLNRIAMIQLNAGGRCVGTLVEFIGIDKHAPIRSGVVETIQKAHNDGRDVVQAVEASLGLFIKRDDQGEVVRATRAPEKK